MTNFLESEVSQGWAQVRDKPLSLMGYHTDVFWNTESAAPTITVTEDIISTKVMDCHWAAPTVSQQNRA